MQKKELRSVRRHFRHAAAKKIHRTGLKTGHYKGKEKSGLAPARFPGTPTSRLATGEAPFRRMAFPGGEDERAGCVQLPSLLF